VCGRFAVDDGIDALVRAYVAEGGDWQDALTALPNWNIRPTDTIAVLIESTREPGAPRRILAPARWGLVPPWSPTATTSVPTFNARLETLGDRPMWKAALAGRRCVVPATAYYEWRGERGAKTPHLIADARGTRLTMAGLAQWWRPSPEAPWLLTATIVTRPAIGALAEIHDRMPLLLTPELVPEWIAADRIGDQAFATSIAEAAATGPLPVARVIASVPPETLGVAGP